MLATAPKELTDSEVKVLAAIDARYRTFPAIALQLELPAYELDGLLVQMVDDQLIRREERGDLAAYFRYETEPVSFWRSGGGRVEATFEADKVPASIEVENKAVASIETPENTSTSEIAKVEEQEPMPKEDIKHPLNAETIEAAAKAGYSVREVAEYFGIPQYSFRDGLRGKGRYKWVKVPWYRGKGGKRGYENGSNGSAQDEPVRETVRAKVVAEPAVVAVLVEQETADEPTGHAAREVIGRVVEDLDRHDAFHDIAENFSFNVGNALIHIQADELEAAIFYLNRERSRRERAAVQV